MKRIENFFLRTTLAICLAVTALGFGGCKDDIDESNMYTFTGQTIYGFLSESENYTKYAQVLEQVKLSHKSNSTFAQLLSARGNYTCFAPTNEALQSYLDSIYLTTNYDIAQLPDSMADYIVRNSLIDNGNKDAYLSTDFYEGALDLTNMDDHYIMISFDTIDGGTLRTMINAHSPLVESDLEMANGIVHGVGHVLEVSRAALPSLIALTPNMRIFAYLLEATGWDQQMLRYRDEDYELNHVEFVKGLDGKTDYKAPDHRYFGYTAFVETDSVFYEWGIPELDIAEGSDVVRNWPAIINAMQEKCAEVYGETDANDLKSVDNAINQFVAYHIVPMKMSWEKMVIHYAEIGYSFRFPMELGIDCYEYYETMTKRRLIKITEGIDSDGRRINRHCKYNTENYRMIPGSDDIPGVLVKSNNGIHLSEALNGFYYPIEEVLLYTPDVPGVVLNERLRWDVSSFLKELVSNNFRRWKDAAQHPMPYDYFEDLVMTPETQYIYLPYFNSNQCNYQGDESNIRGQYDFTLRIPPVPTEGTYELRFSAPANAGFGMAQIYLGMDPQNLPAIGLPLDLRRNIYDPTVGCQDDRKNQPDWNAEVDKNLRIHGYMKPPKHDGMSDGGLAIKMERALRECGGADNMGRYRRMRKILFTGRVTPEDVYYIRVKSVLEDPARCFLLDYVEWCPKNVYAGVDPEDQW